MRLPRINLILAVLGVGLTVAFYFFSVSELRQTRSAALWQLSATATRDAELLEQWRSERVADGKTFSAGLPARLARWRQQNLIQTPMLAQLRTRLQATLEAYNYSGARLFDANQDIILSQVVDGVALDPLDQLNEQPIEGKQPVLSLIHLHTTGEASLILRVPLWHQGQREGQLNFLIQPESLLTWLFSTHAITPDGTHAVLLQKSPNDLLWFAPKPAFPAQERLEKDAHINTDRVKKQDGIQLGVTKTRPIQWNLRQAPAVVAKALAAWEAQGQTSPATFIDDQGIKRFVRFAAVPNSPWVVMTTMERMVVCGPCIKRQVIIGLILVLFFLLLSITLMSWRRAQQQHEVARRNEVLSAAAAAMPGALYVADANTFQTLFISKGIRYLLGYETEDVLSLPDFFVSFLYQEDREATIAQLNALVTSHNTFTILNYRAWTNDRSHWVWIEDRVFIKRTERGKASLIYGLMFNITDRKFAEQQLRDTNQSLKSLNTKLQVAHERANELAKQASAASQAKSEFLANMSHEIRTPLTAIIGITDLLNESSLNDEQLQYVETLRSASRGLLTLINDILDFSKIEKGCMTLEQADFALDPLIDEVVTVATVQAKHKGLELIVDIAPEVPAWISGDSLRLQQVLINLLSNAVKFTSQGEVILRVRRLEARGPTDNVQTDSVALEFSVQDTGIGIAPERQTALFEAFTQADSSTTRQFGGTGLGLSIAASLVSLMQSSLQLDSNLGQGSRFFFTLQLKPLETPTLAFQQPTWPGRRALIVADNQPLREVLCRHLSALEMQVETASHDPVALVRRLEATPLDLIMIDYHRADSSTEALIRTLSDSFTATPPRMIVLASSGLYGQLTGLRQQAHLVLSKPVQRLKLRQALSHVLQSAPPPTPPSQPPQAGAGTEPGSGTRSTTGPSSTPGSTSLATEPGATAEPGACILITDDEPTNQIVLRKVLEKLGYQVVVAVNGRDAIEKLSQQPCDLVLMDVRMPEMNGHQATRAIRAPDSSVLNPQVPIIALTAEAVAGERDAAFAAGMNGFLTKPIEIAALKETIKRWLE
ncbi:PAS domain-containing hybrid sensor histidine kinase/response regulator [Rhabdochromatium marinum]|uniref:PAS domain-containing hybrid sensor histidine kinase/response regulator n=1 Tax=Rhabdochromatium marinum TaxID=48729 RepID=UPI001905D759|nr:response regulator [Rhabdochromatium marinum]MBK1647937.1 hypothetical protein [Rhabdochromatium marinum]